MGQYQLCQLWAMQLYRTFARLLLGCGLHLFAHMLQESASGALGNPQPPPTHRYPPLTKPVNYGIFLSFLAFLQLASRTLFSLLTPLTNLAFFSVVVILWERVWLQREPVPVTKLAAAARQESLFLTSTQSPCEHIPLTLRS